MKKLTSDLKVINKQLNILSKKISIVAEALEERTRISMTPEILESSKKSKVKKDRISSSTKAVIEIIQNHQGGINVHTLKEETGFDTKQISNIVHRAVKKGIVQRAGRGVYKAA